MHPRLQTLVQGIVGGCSLPRAASNSSRKPTHSASRQRSYTRAILKGLEPLTCEGQHSLVTVRSSPVKSPQRPQLWKGNRSISMHLHAVSKGGAHSKEDGKGGHRMRAALAGTRSVLVRRDKGAAHRVRKSSHLQLKAVILGLAPPRFVLFSLLFPGSSLLAARTPWGLVAGSPASPGFGCRLPQPHDLRSSAHLLPTVP